MTRIKDTSKTQPKIKHAGKSEPLVDIKKIAEGLGADVVMSNKKRSKDGRNYRVITRIVTISHRIKEKIYELDKKDTQKHALLGTAEGMDFFHCIYLAAKHAKDFWKRVCGYRIETPNFSENEFAVSFYEKK